MSQEKTKNVRKGQPLSEKLQWPKIANVVSINSVELIVEKLKLNPEVTVSEKLDGSNICISSDGWVASRRQIILEDFDNKEELQKVTFSRIPLTKIELIRDPLRAIHSSLIDTLSCCHFQTLLYGEWLQSGTATTRNDKYGYKSRLIKGYPYIFGLAISFKNQLKQREEIKRRIEERLGTIIEEDETHFKIGLNEKLHRVLVDNGLSTVPFENKIQFKTALSDQSNIDRLLNRKIEGFVFTSEHSILKWKAIESEDKAFQIKALEEIKNKLKPDIDASIGALETVCLSNNIAQDITPKKRVTKKLLTSLYKSAETKFPRLEDQFRTWRQSKHSTPEEAEEKGYFRDIAVSLANQLQQEIGKDLRNQGYLLDQQEEEDLTEVVNSITEVRYLNWRKRFHREREETK